MPCLFTSILDLSEARQRRYLDPGLLAQPSPYVLVAFPQPCPILTEMFCRIRAESFGPLAERIFHFVGDDGCGTRMAAGLPGPEDLMPNRIGLRVVSPDRRPLSR